MYFSCLPVYCLFFYSCKKKKPLQYSDCFAFFFIQFKTQTIINFILFKSNLDFWSSWAPKWWHPCSIKKKGWIWFGSWFLITELPCWYFWHLFSWKQSSARRTVQLWLSVSCLMFICLGWRCSRSGGNSTRKLPLLTLNGEEICSWEHPWLFILFFKWPPLVLFWTKITVLKPWRVSLFYFILGHWLHLNAACLHKSFICISLRSFCVRFDSLKTTVCHILWSSDVFSFIFAFIHLNLTLLADGYILIFLHHFAIICVLCL